MHGEGVCSRPGDGVIAALHDRTELRIGRGGGLERSSATSATEIRIGESDLPQVYTIWHRVE